MRGVIQRVLEASVAVDGQPIGQIGPGLLIFIGVEAGDTAEDAEWMAHKTANLRILPDELGKMNRSVVEADGQLLVVSQFTLHASTKKGNRPSFFRSAEPQIAKTLYEEFCRSLAKFSRMPVKQGQFGADMKVALVNDGPVTILIDSRARE